MTSIISRDSCQGVGEVFSSLENVFSSTNEETSESMKELTMKSGRLAKVSTMGTTIVSAAQAELDVIQKDTSYAHDANGIAERGQAMQDKESDITCKSSAFSTYQQFGETDVEQTNTISVKALTDSIPNSIQEAQGLIKVNDTLIQNLGKV